MKQELNFCPKCKPKFINLLKKGLENIDQPTKEEKKIKLCGWCGKEHCDVEQVAKEVADHAIWGKPKPSLPEKLEPASDGWLDEHEIKINQILDYLKAKEDQ